MCTVQLLNLLWLSNFSPGFLLISCHTSSHTRVKNKEKLTWPSFKNMHGYTQSIEVSFLHEISTIEGVVGYWSRQYVHVVQTDQLSYFIQHVLSGGMVGGVITNLVTGTCQ